MPISRLNKKNPRTLKIHHEAAASCRRVLNIHSSMNSWPLYHFSTIISFPCCFYRAEWKAKIDIFTTLKKHTLHHFLCRTSLFFHSWCTSSSFQAAPPSVWQCVWPDNTSNFLCSSKTKPSRANTLSWITFIILCIHFLQIFLVFRLSYPPLPKTSPCACLFLPSFYPRSLVSFSSSTIHHVFVCSSRSHLAPEKRMS